MAALRALGPLGSHCTRDPTRAPLILTRGPALCMGHPACTRPPLHSAPPPLSSRGGPLRLGVNMRGEGFRESKAPWAAPTSKPAERPVILRPCRASLFWYILQIFIPASARPAWPVPAAPTRETNLPALVHSPRDGALLACRRGDTGQGWAAPPRTARRRRDDEHHGPRPHCVVQGKCSATLPQAGAWPHRLSARPRRGPRCRQQRIS